MRAFTESACVICRQNESYVSALSNGRAFNPAWLCTLYTYTILQTINTITYTSPCYINLFKGLAEIILGLGGFFPLSRS